MPRASFLALCDTPSTANRTQPERPGIGRNKRAREMVGFDRFRLSYDSLRNSVAAHVAVVFNRHAIFIPAGKTGKP